MPDISDLTRGPAEMLLNLSGEDVDLINEVVDERDDYGDPVDPTPVVETTVAEIVVRGTPTFERRIDGVDSEVTAVAWIMDTYEDDVYTGGESSDRKPTTVDSETHAYLVHNWFNENNGKLRLHLE